MSSFANRLVSDSEIHFPQFDDATAERSADLDPMLGDVFVMGIDDRPMRAVVIWTSGPTVGVLYLDETGRAATEALVKSWLPPEAKSLIRDADRNPRLRPSVARPRLHKNLTTSVCGVVVDISLESGRQCHGIAEWPAGRVPTVRLFV